MGLGTGVYGTNASNAVSYSIGSVNTSTAVSAAKFNELAARINDERSRRGNATTSLTIASPIHATEYNNMVNALNVYGPAATQSYNTSGTVTITTFPQVGPPSLPGGVAAGNAITAAQINNLINSIVSAGSACTCNCNYCTCNCNYCTCNCNYACTCNCNYSDERLKENITLIGTQDGVNVYSYTYIWNKAKTYIGVLAQEILETKYASAVMTDKNGFYYVDYSQLPVNMKEA